MPPTLSQRGAHNGRLYGKNRRDLGEPGKLDRVDRYTLAQRMLGTRRVV
jgi:hypothetical protein